MFGKKVLGFLISVTLVTFSIYFCSFGPYPLTFLRSSVRDQVWDGGQSNVSKLRKIRRKRPLLNLTAFNVSGHDVMVFLHIQKTGGTSFGKNLVKNLVLERPCEKTPAVKSHFECKRPNSNEFWLYSRYSTGWVCGLHADWTTLTSCVPKVLKSHLGIGNINKTRLFYVSWLRDPIDRFLSEFKHVQRGATWKKSTFVCNDTKYDLPLCFEGSSWRNVNLSEFLNCPHNLAFNRQTRMLANLNEVGCYSLEKLTSRGREQEKIMLESAKQNLQAMSYFGLVEYQKESQYLFEMTFGLKFKKDFYQLPVSDTWSYEARDEVTPKQFLQIRKVNRLDRQLYSYAKTLFFKKLKYFERANEERISKEA